MLSEVPEGWSAPAPLSIYASNETRKWNKVEVLPYVGLEHIEQGTGQLLGFGESQSVTSAKNLFEPGDVLFGKLRPNLRKFWKADRRGICSTDILVLKNKQGLESNYLYAVVQSEPFLTFAENDAAGTKMPRTSWKRLETVELPIPPLNEQHRIVENLSSVDASIQATQAVIEQAERVKRGLREELLTGGLGSEAIERGEVPEGWTKCSLGEVLSLEYGKSLPEKTRKAGAYPVYGSAGIVGSHNEYLVESQSIVVGRKGTIGAIYKTTQPFFPIDTTYYVVAKNKINWDWLTALLESLQLARLNEATGVPGLNRERAYASEIFVPPFNEQLRIAGILNDSDSFISKQRETVGQLTRIRRGLTDDLLTGKVRTV